MRRCNQRNPHNTLVFKPKLAKRYRSQTLTQRVKLESTKIISRRLLVETQACFETVPTSKASQMDNGFSRVDYSLKTKYSYDFVKYCNFISTPNEQQVICNLEKLRLKNIGFLHWLFIFLSAKAK